MGRWAQARRRGRGVPDTVPLPTPDALDWSLTAGGEGLALATYVGSSPPDTDGWQSRWYVEPFTDWTLGAFGGFEIEFEFEGLGMLHVEVRYRIESTGEFGPWSAEKVVENT